MAAEGRHAFLPQATEDRQSFQDIPVQEEADIAPQCWWQFIQDLGLIESLGAFVSSLVVCENLSAVRFA